MLDTNIIVYALSGSNDRADKCRKFINENLNSLVVSDQNINEAVRVLTHPKFSKNVTSKKALKSVRQITDECTHICPTLTTREVFFDLCNKYQVESNVVYDAYLVAVAISNSVATIASFNIKDLKIFSEIKLIEVVNL